jgi:Flp pilus assembly protein TadG
VLRTLREEAGQATVEFAIVVVPLLVFVYALVQGGVAVNRYVTLNDAVRAAARAASVSSTIGAAQTAANQAISDATGGAVTSVQLVQPPGSSWASGEPVTVKATWDWSISLPVGTAVGITQSFTSQTTQRIE